MPSLDLKPRQQVLLCFLNSSKNGQLDPIRIMKGLFLFAKETPNAWAGKDSRYEFEPYNYGPFSQEVYTDLSVLSSSGYVKASLVSGASWPLYGLTDKGKFAAKTAEKQMDKRAVGYIREICAFVEGHGFRSLLSAIYKKYPKYAERSVFK